MSAVVAVGSLALLVLVVCGIAVGAVGIEPMRVIEVIRARAAGMPVAGPHDYIVWQLRMPRVILAAVVGASLAVAGCIAQVLVRNPIADPFVLGLSSGASVAAVAVVTTAGMSIVGAFTLPIAAFVGALAAGVLVLVMSASRDGLTPGRLVLTGIAMAQLLAGVASFLIVRTHTPEATQQVVEWLLGSLAGAQWLLVGAVLAPTALGLIGAAALSRRLDLLSVGDDATAVAGARPGRVRAGAFVLAALLTGAAVAVSGTIGFVGLIVPHVARFIVGARHRRLLPTSALLGAILLVSADIAARTVLAPTEVPVGIFTALIGVPVFVGLLRTTRTPMS